MKLVSLFARPLGADCAPFGHSEKCAAVASIAPVIAGLMGQVSSIASAGGASSYNLAATKLTNDTNLELARQTNEMSQAQFDENMQWLREQFYKQREYALDERAYNDPSAIVERLKRAGINPAAFFGQGATSTPSVSSVGAPSQSDFQTGYQQAPHMDPVSYDLSGVAEGIGRAVDAYHQNKLVNAQTEKTRYDGQISRATSITQLSENIARIRKLIAETDEALSRKGVSDAQRDVLLKQKEDYQNQIDLFNMTLEDQVRSLQLSNDRIERETRHIDKVEELMDDDAARKWAEFYVNREVARSGINVDNANIALTLANKSYVELKRDGVQLDNDFMRAVHNYRVAKEKYEAALAKTHSSNVFLHPEKNGNAGPFREDYFKSLEDLDKEVDRISHGGKVNLKKFILK